MGHAINKVSRILFYIILFFYMQVFRKKIFFIYSQILKDITLRSKVITGKRVHYVPGWDCHGLPIEQKVLSNIKDANPLEIRRKGMLRIKYCLYVQHYVLFYFLYIAARKYASNAIAKQKQVFMSWGIMADWNESGCYFTNNTLYVKNQLHQFMNLYDKGLVFRAFKPVHWSPSSRYI